MTTRSDAYIQASMDLIYRNTNFAGVGDTTGVRGSTAPGSLHVALMTETGEVAYTGYARGAVERSASGWNRAGNVVTNASDVVFTLVPEGTTPQTATRAAIYTAGTSGTLLHTATLPVPIPIQAGIRPVIEAGAIIITGS